MPKNNIADWDTSQANNTDIAGLPLNDSADPSTVDDWTRHIMAQLKTFFSGVMAVGGIGTGTSLGEKFTTYGTPGTAGSFGVGVESGAQTYKANGAHRFYSGANSDGGTSDVFEITSSGANVAGKQVIVTTDYLQVFPVGTITPLFNGTGSAIGSGSTVSGANLSIPTWTGSGVSSSGATQSGTTWQAMGGNVLASQVGMFKRTA